MIIAPHSRPKSPASAYSPRASMVRPCQAPPVSERFQVWPKDLPAVFGTDSRCSRSHARLGLGQITSVSLRQRSPPRRGFLVHLSSEINAALAKHNVDVAATIGVLCEGRKFELSALVQLAKRVLIGHPREDIRASSIVIHPCTPTGSHFIDAASATSLLPSSRRPGAGPIGARLKKAFSRVHTLMITSGADQRAAAEEQTRNVGSEGCLPSIWLGNGMLCGPKNDQLGPRRRSSSAAASAILVHRVAARR